MDSTHQETGSLSGRVKTRRWLAGLVIGGIALLITGAALIALRLLSPTHLDPYQVMPPRLGAPISDFELKDLQGRFVKLSDYRGKVVLVNAWAAWCAPCKAEMPLLDSYYQAHNQQGFVVLAVNTGDPAGFLNDFLKTVHPTFPILLDPM